MASIAPTGKTLIIATSPGAVKPEEEVIAFLFNQLNSAVAMAAEEIMHTLEGLILPSDTFLSG